MTSGTIFRELTLRPATEADLDFLFEVRRQTIRGYVEELWGRWSDEEQRQRFEDSAELAVTSVIEQRGVPVGGLTVRHEVNHVFLSRIHLLPTAQGQGIGTFLVRQVIEAARDEGRPVRLEVLRNNPALHLYERLGFRVTGENATNIVMEHRGGAP